VGSPRGSIAALYNYEEFESSHGRQPGSLKALAEAKAKRAGSATRKPKKGKNEALLQILPGEEPGSEK
jgi:hypothetical protein